MDAVKHIADSQLEILADLDAFLGLRRNFTLARWINQSHALGENEAEKRYFDKNARTLITVWGNLYGDCSSLYDYAWREWNGLIKEYYAMRWEKFYTQAIDALENGKDFPQAKPTDTVWDRPRFDATAFGRELFQFEKHWCETYSEYDEPQNRDVTDTAQALYEKYCTNETISF